MPLDHQIDVARFDADDVGRAILDARWRIFDGSGDRLLSRGCSAVCERASVAVDYQEIAAAVSRCMAIMSREIADVLIVL